MENTIRPPAEKILDNDSLYFALLIFQDVNETLRGVHMIVAVLLRYVEVGASITKSLLELSATAAFNES